MFQEVIRKIRKIRQQKAVILMYHQVSERKNDPWELAVHPNHFYDQLEYLKSNCNVISVSELAARVAEGRVRDHTVAITFDDGFKDNYTIAAPLLDWHEMPASFYVPTSMLLDGKVYWWDALEEILFYAEMLPASFEMTINGVEVKFAFRSDRVLQKRIINQIRVWNYTLPIPNERIALYMLLWSHIKPLPYGHQNKLLEDIKDWANFKPDTLSQRLTMTVRETQMLSDNPLFSIGAHTVHHAMLSGQNPSEQAYEVKESKRQIEKWLGKPVDGFAYPYGSYDEITRQLIKEAGFVYAVATESKAATKEDDPFALPRIQVKNWCVYEFASKINEMVYG